MEQLPDIPVMTGWTPEAKKKVMMTAIAFMFMHLSVEEEFQQMLELDLQVIMCIRATHTNTH